MNPFKNIAVKDRFRINPHSPNYGRYRLNFNQVTPFREPLLETLALKINDPERASIYCDLLPDQLYNLIHFRRPEDEQGNFVFPKDYEYLLHFDMVSDSISIAMENIYFAVQELAEVLEDCHFFIYSTGDDDNRWLDEYKIENGKRSFFHRNICDDQIYTGRLDFYIKRAMENIDDYAFVRFVLYQLYDRLNFWTRNDQGVPYWTSKHQIETVATVDIIQGSTMLDKMRQYFISFYSLDKDCPDWYSINRKYKLRK